MNVNTYNNLDEACNDIISKISHLNSRTQTSIQAQVGGRSFTVVTERGRVLDPERFILNADTFEHDNERQMLEGNFERKVKVSASKDFNAQDIEKLSDIFCKAFGSNLVTISQSVK